MQERKSFSIMDTFISNSKLLAPLLAASTGLAEQGESGVLALLYMGKAAIGATSESIIQGTGVNIPSHIRGFLGNLMGTLTMSSASPLALKMEYMLNGDPDFLASIGQRTDLSYLFATTIPGGLITPAFMLAFDLINLGVEAVSRSVDGICVAVANGLNEAMMDLKS